MMTNCKVAALSFSIAMAFVFGGGASATSAFPGTGVVPECRVPYNPKILEFGGPPTGAPINYGSPSPFTVAPTGSPTQPPTISPTPSPTNGPTAKPRKSPTKKPTKPPKKTPTKKPSKAPTASPTKAPTTSPTNAPSTGPTKAPTRKPTAMPTRLPSKAPTTKPTKAPTRSPTAKPSKAPTKPPTRRPTKAPTKRPTKSPTRPPTKAPTKPPTKAPTKSPTRAPTQPPTTKPSLPPTRSPTKVPTKAPVAVQCIPAETSLVQQYGTISYSKLPITIVPGSQTGTTVTVSIEQVWKSSRISWIATRFTDPSLGESVCPKKEEVSPGFVSYGVGDCSGASSKSYGTEITAACDNGAATIEVYVHDGQFKGQPYVAVPSECNPSRDSSKKIGYRFSVPCDACPTGNGAAPAPVTPAAKVPTQTPTDNPTPAPTKQPTKPTKFKPWWW